MSGLRQSCISQKPTRALLSIRPEFAQAILKGEKKYEFRRSIFKRPVKVVLVYATNPIKHVIAEFDVQSVISDTLGSLWARTKSYAGIDEDLFYRYFKGKKHGYAIEIGEVRPYSVPFCPTEEFGVHPPQSFLYLDSEPER